MSVKFETKAYSMNKSVIKDTFRTYRGDFVPDLKPLETLISFGTKTFW